ncbi:MAG TPA: LptA/OstA family protein [Stenomitos sp.]
MNKAVVSMLGVGMVVALMGAPAVSATKPAAKAKPPQPLPAAVSLDQMDITARQTEYDGQEHTYAMSGNVRISLRDMVVTCQAATVYATPKEDRVDRIVFSGQVEARRGTGVFRGEKVTYFVAERRLLAEGGTHTRLLVPASASATPGGIR